MISAAPTDFWERVIERVARFVFERECNLERSRYEGKLGVVLTSPPPLPDKKLTGGDAA